MLCYLGYSQWRFSIQALYGYRGRPWYRGTALFHFLLRVHGAVVAYTHLLIHPYSHLYIHLLIHPYNHHYPSICMRSVAAQWSCTGLQVNWASLHQEHDLYHNSFHLPKLSPAQYSLTVTNHGLHHHLFHFLIIRYYFTNPTIATYNEILLHISVVWIFWYFSFI